ncbi:MAG: hypothetical protein ACREJB_00405, partial [Planctomycetaceae bacterium]
AEITVNNRYGPGELVPIVEDEIQVAVRVLAPHWVTASQVELYANGQKVREALMPTEPDRKQPPGVKWAGSWTLPRPKHDAHLVAVARGPGISGLYWPTAKPYQPTSPDPTTHTLGVSGAVWLDVDGDGRRTPARDYAERLLRHADGELPALLALLANSDAAVAAHAAFLYHSAGGSLTSAETQSALKTATPAVREGFRAYFEAWRETQAAGGVRPGE